MVAGVVNGDGRPPGVGARSYDLFISNDNSQPETIKRNLRERTKNAKQIVLLGSATGRRKGSDGRSFLAYEVKVAIEFDLPSTTATTSTARIAAHRRLAKPLIDGVFIRTPFE